MRIVIRLLAASAVLLAAALPAAAQAPQLPPCDGTYAVVRHSVVKPGSSMEKFMAAVDAHKAWYASHGYKDDIIFASRIAERDPATGKWTYSATDVLTFHYYPAGPAKMPTHDAAWDAYTKLYSESSTIKETTQVCIPKGMVPMIM